MRPGLVLEAGVAVPRDSGWLAPGERRRLAAMRVPRRRNDFRRGRWTAKRALARVLGLGRDPDFTTLSQIEIVPGERGAPFVELRGRRVDCELSISHSRGAALCALGPGGPRIGCDVEWVEPRSPAFARHCLREEERSWLEARPWDERAEAANLVWSAKECALKALGTGLDVDVRQLRLRLLPERTGGFLVVVPGDVGALWGRWGRHAGWLWTVASSEPLDFAGALECLDLDGLAPGSCAPPTVRIRAQSGETRSHVG